MNVSRWFVDKGSRPCDPVALQIAPAALQDIAQHLSPAVPVPIYFTAARYLEQVDPAAVRQIKPLRFDLSNGRWVNLLKVTGGGKVNRHRHSGGQVLGYVLKGGWRYLERDWVARPGTFVYEPPGDIHTLVVDEGEEMQTLFLLEGVIQYLDDDNRVNYQDDVFTKLERYHKYCRENGLQPVDLCY